MHPASIKSWIVAVTINLTYSKQCLTQGFQQCSWLQLQAEQFLKIHRSPEWGKQEVRRIRGRKYSISVWKKKESENKENTVFISISVALKLLQMLCTMEIIHPIVTRAVCPAVSDTYFSASPITGLLQTYAYLLKLSCSRQSSNWQGFPLHIHSI